MRCTLHDESGGVNWILLELYAGDGAAAKGGAVHDGGVQLVSAGAGKYGALSRVELGIIFQENNDGFDRFDGRAAAGENVFASVESSQQRCVHQLNLILTQVVGYLSCTTVQCDGPVPGSRHRTRSLSTCP